MESGCTEETMLKPMERQIHISIDGKDVPVGRFVQGFLSNTLIGMLASLKKADVKDGSLIEIRLKVKR